MILKAALLCSTLVACATNAQVVNTLDLIESVDPLENDYFGSALDLDDSYLVIDQPRSRDVFVFDRSDGSMVRRISRVRSSTFYGEVQIDNGLIAAGDHESGDDTGVVRVFDAASGDQLHTLAAPQGQRGDLFGDAIAMDNGLIAISAPAPDLENRRTGLVYLFDAATGDLVRTIDPPGRIAGDGFGTSVALDNGLLAVGTNPLSVGSADTRYAYLIDTSTGEVIHQFQSFGPQSDRFGYAVALDGGLVAVGAPNDGTDPGAVFVYETSTGFPISKLTPENGNTTTDMGTRVHLADGAAFCVGSNSRMYCFDVYSRKQT